MNGNDFDESLRRDWEEAEDFRHLPSRISKNMFSNISREVFERKRSLRVSISVAASILVIISGLLLTKNPAPVKQVVLEQELATLSDQWIVERNLTPQRPFVVKSGAFSTTALGTVFSVAEKRNAISVKLYSGKVVIRNENEEVFLNPGEQAILGNGTRQVTRISIH